MKNYIYGWVLYNPFIVSETQNSPEKSTKSAWHPRAWNFTFRCLSWLDVENHGWAASSPWATPLRRLLCLVYPCRNLKYLALTKQVTAALVWSSTTHCWHTRQSFHPEGNQVFSRCLNNRHVGSRRGFQSWWSYAQAAPLPKDKHMQNRALNYLHTRGLLAR